MTDILLGVLFIVVAYVVCIVGKVPSTMHNFLYGIAKCIGDNKSNKT